jgi:hypothetical protein
MRKRLLRLSLATLALAIIGILAAPNSAWADGCPSHVTNGEMACHNTAGSKCSSCTYHCDDGTNHQWNVCDIV